MPVLNTPALVQAIRHAAQTGHALPPDLLVQAADELERLTLARTRRKVERTPFNYDDR